MTSSATRPDATGEADATDAADALHRLVGFALRGIRRRLGLNQRELARRAGVGQATVARLEAGRDAHLAVVAACLAVGGLELVVVGPDGLPWLGSPDASDHARDTGGRRLPAHLMSRQGRLPTYTVTRRMIAGTWQLRSGHENWLYQHHRVCDDGPQEGVSAST
jgi:transcriptional regulator with XRE-family HTH domain